MTHTQLIRFTFVAVGSLAVFLAAGCGSSAATSFYTLTSMNAPKSPNVEAKGASVSLGIGPVALPLYLDRPQIVTRKDETSLDLAEFDNWAEPLAVNFVRVLSENLSALVGTERLRVFPWGTAPVDFQVQLEVIRFDAEPAGGARLVARWSVLGKDGAPLVPPRKSVHTAPASAQTWSATVAALSNTLAALSREIAAAIKTPAGG